MNKIKIFSILAISGLVIFPLLSIAQNASSALVVTSISPNSALVGSRVTMTVNGYGFMNGAVVSFNGLPAFTSYVSPSQLTAIIPSTYLPVAVTNLVQVTNPGGVVSNGLSFKVLSATAPPVPGLPETGFGPAK